MITYKETIFRRQFSNKPKQAKMTTIKQEEFYCTPTEQKVAESAAEEKPPSRAPSPPAELSPLELAAHGIAAEDTLPDRLDIEYLLYQSDTPPPPREKHVIVLNDYDAGAAEEEQVLTGTLYHYDGSRAHTAKRVVLMIFGDEVGPLKHTRVDLWAKRVKEAGADKSEHLPKGWLISNIDEQEKPAPRGREIGGRSKTYSPAYLKAVSEFKPERKD